MLGCGGILGKVGPATLEKIAFSIEGYGGAEGEALSTLKRDYKSRIFSVEIAGRRGGETTGVNKDGGATLPGSLKDIFAKPLACLKHREHNDSLRERSYS